MAVSSTLGSGPDTGYGLRIPPSPGNGTPSQKYSLLLWWLGIVNYAATGPFVVPNICWVWFLAD